MDLTAEEEITRKSYDKTAKRWEEDHWTPKFWGEDFDSYFEFLPKGRVLEVGCGAGRDAQELIKQGYDYLGTDISANLLAQARKNNPGASFERVSIYDLDFKKPFDGFWCAAMLIHIPRDRINKALQGIKRSIKTDAVGFISVKQGKGDLLEQRNDLAGQQFYFVFWENEEFKAVLKKNGFQVLRENYKPMSERTKWLTYIVSNS